ncbi:hypothetical protein [Paraburkholderia sp.]
MAANTDRAARGQYVPHDRVFLRRQVCSENADCFGRNGLQVAAHLE